MKAKTPGSTGDSSRPPGPRRLLAELRRSLRSVRDPAKAPGMQAYMRSVMPFLGVPAPRVYQVCRQLFADQVYPDRETWVRSALYLWRHAQFREERYSAIAFTGLRSVASFQTPATIPLYEEMIVTGAWWDYVDEIAIRRVGPILREFPGTVARAMRRWSTSDDLWKRRTSIICQVGSKGEIDLPLLYDCIEPSIGEREFFLRKAIGWALRQLARIDPAEVRRYVERNHGRLSPLSVREALRHVSS